MQQQRMPRYHGSMRAGKALSELFKVSIRFVNVTLQTLLEHVGQAVP